MDKKFNGKAIYNPSGKAGEYSYWACNFYTGCSNGCEYCYCKKGVMAHTWSDTPKLKACFKDNAHALDIFEKELKANLPELQKHGLFFTFTSDPFLPETVSLYVHAAYSALLKNVPVKFLTKRADWIEGFVETFGNRTGETVDFPNFIIPPARGMVAFGFTLTNHDEMEPGASPNIERIDAMRTLKVAGFQTWASIEPVIDFASGLQMIMDSSMYCDLYKIGLQSGKKYPKLDVNNFVSNILGYFNVYRPKAKIYFKDGLLTAAGIDRDKLPTACCVGRDFNIFNI